MDWNNIISFMAGGLIAIIPVIISNRYQAEEKDKDRLEQRREAKIQSREKWMERDILKLMDFLDDLLNSFTEKSIFESDFADLQNEIENGLPANQELLANIQSERKRFKAIDNESTRTIDRMSKIVFSFEDEEIKSAFVSFTHEVVEDGKSRESHFDTNKYNPMLVRKSAGDLHRVLRDKLISLRDIN